MSTSKHIDLICVVILLCTLLVTGLFMCGEALGIQVIKDADAGDSYFTANDLNADWDTSGATRITLTGDGGSVKGNGAYVYNGDVHIVYAGKYVLSGELTDGSVIVDADGDDKIWLLLDGVSLHCDDSAAIVVKQADKVFLTLGEGTENVISSGETFSKDAISSKIDGTIYSRDDLTINGNGSLTVTADYKHGIVANDDLVITGGNIEITAPQDGIHAHDSIRLTDMELTVTAGDDGIHASNDDESSYIYIASGSINIPSCYEGIEAIDITIAGGEIDIRPTDDGINANGQGRNSAIHITGGDITIINETGRDADGLDSNGSIYVSGGNTFISVNTASCALDYGSENGGVCEISGGTVVAAGGSTMAEGFDSSSEQNFIMYNTSTSAAGTAVTLKNEGGETLVSETIPCSFSSVVISTPELQLGETCTISVGDSAEEITVDNSTSGGFGAAGMFGGGMKVGGFGGRGNRFSDEQTDAVGGATAQTQPQNVPELPDGEVEGGERPQRPDGAFNGGEIPQVPDGETGRGQRPQMPNGDFNGGEAPKLPDGDVSNGEPPQIPDGETGRGQRPQITDGELDGQDFSGRQFPGNRNGDGRPGDTQIPDETAAEPSALSPDTLIPVGVSALFLLAGLLIAWKVRH